MDHACVGTHHAPADPGGASLADPPPFPVVDANGPFEPGKVERAHAWGIALAGLLNGCGARPMPC